MLTKITLSALALALSVSAAISAPVNWCKERKQSECTAAVACSWRVTTTDGVSKTSCIYNAKAAKEMVAKSLNIKAKTE